MIAASKDGKSLDLIPFEETSMYVKVTKNYKCTTSYIARKVKSMNKIKFMTIILVMVASLVGCSMEEESGEVLENKPSATSKTINLTMMHLKL